MSENLRMNNSVKIIAEAGVNHNGNRNMAFGLIDAAAQAGADVIKFQTFSAKKLATARAPKAAYQKVTTDAKASQKSMLENLELPEEWHAPLRDHARKCGMEFISTAFDADSLKFLATLDLGFYKIASGEITNGPLLWRTAQLRRPLIVSTGMASLAEVEQALAVICHALTHDQEPYNRHDIWQSYSNDAARSEIAKLVTLLHCTSQYPTPMVEVNLRAMGTLKSSFGLPVGYSDHTKDSHVSVAAVALGATVIEKHLTLDRNLPGPDHAASLEPTEFADMVHQIRQISTALGGAIKITQPSEWDTRAAARQRVVAVRRIKGGTAIVREDLGTARSDSGAPAMELWGLVGRTASTDFDIGDGINL